MNVCITRSPQGLKGESLFHRQSYNLLIISADCSLPPKIAHYHSELPIHASQWPSPSPGGASWLINIINLVFVWPRLILTIYNKKVLGSNPLTGNINKKFGKLPKKLLEIYRKITGNLPENYWKFTGKLPG